MKTAVHIFTAIMAIFVVAFVFCGHALAEDTPVGRLETVFGNVTVERGGTSLTGAVDTEIWPADVLHVEKNSTAMLKFTDGSSIVATANSSVAISQYVAMAQGKQFNANMVLDVIKGKLRFFFKKTDTTVRTPNATIGVRGTTFFVDTTAKATTVVMVEGRVAVANLAHPNVAVELGNAQLTRIIERASPEVPVKAPPMLLIEMNNAVKNVDLGKAGGAVEPPKNSPTPAATPTKQGKKTETKPVEEGKLVVQPNGESTLDAPTQTPSEKVLPQESTSPTPTPAPAAEQVAAPKLADPGAAVEKAVQQINTTVSRPIDAKNNSVPQKTKIGVNTK